MVFVFHELKIFCLCKERERSTCQLSFSRLLAKTVERNPENGNNKKKRKYKETENFLREITLEENIEAADTTPGEREKISNRVKLKMYKCSVCDKRYKFASGLQHHIKHSHGEDDIN